MSTSETVAGAVGSSAASAIAEGLFTWPSAEPALLGSKCDRCGTLTFPTATGCPKCSSEALTTVPLSTRGRLWTWTSQEFRPKSPPYIGRDDGAFEPFFVGYVELPEGLRVEAHLSGIVDRHPEIGEEMELTIIPFAADGDRELVTFAFQPVGTDAETSARSDA